MARPVRTSIGISLCKLISNISLICVYNVLYFREGSFVPSRPPLSIFFSIFFFLFFIFKERVLKASKLCIFVFFLFLFMTECHVFDSGVFYLLDKLKWGCCWCMFIFVLFTSQFPRKTKHDYRTENG